MSQEEQQEKNGKRIRGKAPETLLTEALENLTRLSQAKTVEPERIQAARTLVVAYKDMVSDKKADTAKKLRDENEKLKQENEQLKLKAQEVPPDAVEKISSLETENKDLRQRLLTHPKVEIQTVTTPDPATAAENVALKEAVKHLAEGLSNDRKVEIVIELFDKRRPVAKALAEVFRVPWDDVVALMGKSSADLIPFQNAYRSPLAAIALTIRAHRVQMESKAKKEKNDMRLAVEATPIPPSPEEIQARAYIDAQYTPEVRAIRERAVLAAAERAKESHPDPTSPGIREIEAEIAYERALPEKIAALKERLAEMKASVTASDIT